MKKYLFLFFIAIELAVSMEIAMEGNAQNITADVQIADEPKKLSRHKRYMAFPEGSSFSVRILSNIISTAKLSL